MSQIGDVVKTTTSQQDQQDIDPRSRLHMSRPRLRPILWLSKPKQYQDMRPKLMSPVILPLFIAH